MHSWHTIGSTDLYILPKNIIYFYDENIYFSLFIPFIKLGSLGNRPHAVPANTPRNIYIVHMHNSGFLEACPQNFTVAKCLPGTLETKAMTKQTRRLGNQ